MRGVSCRSLVLLLVTGIFVNTDATPLAVNVYTSTCGSNGCTQAQWENVVSLLGALKQPVGGSDRTAELTITKLAENNCFDGTTTISELNEFNFYRALSCYYLVNTDASNTIQAADYTAWKALTSNLFNAGTLTAPINAATWNNFTNDFGVLMDIGNDQQYNAEEYRRFSLQITTFSSIAASPFPIGKTYITQQEALALLTKDTTAYLSALVASTNTISRADIIAMGGIEQVKKAANKAGLSLIMINDVVHITNCETSEGLPDVAQCLSTAGVTADMFDKDMTCKQIREEQQKFVSCAYKHRPQCCQNIKKLVLDYFDGTYEDKCWSEHIGDTPLYCPTEATHMTSVFNSGTSLYAGVWLAGILAALQVVAQYSYV